LARALTALGLFVHPSATNFLLVDFDRDAAPIEAALLARGVVVRPMGGYGLPTCLRINTGTAIEHERLISALTEALA
jgi:histidinol-phosphate aminotransferase